MCINTVLKTSLSIDELRHKLSVQKASFLLYSKLPAEKIYLQFEGKLSGKTIVWNACIRTINDYARMHQVADDPKQFIDIKIKKNDYLIEIALNIEQIDRAVIERTIIMIRKYKQLHVGRHEYGVRSKTQ